MERSESGQKQLPNHFCRVGKVTPKKYWEEEDEVEMSISSEIAECDSGSEDLNIRY